MFSSLCNTTFWKSGWRKIKSLPMSSYPSLLRSAYTLDDFNTPLQTNALLFFCDASAVFTGQNSPTFSAGVPEVPGAAGEVPKLWESLQLQSHSDHGPQQFTPLCFSSALSAPLSTWPTPTSLCSHPPASLNPDTR